MPQVSIHLVTYNNDATIETTLQSALSQKEIKFDIVVIDNASTDETVKRVQSLGVNLICNTSNIGYAAAHNQAISHTDSAYILTLNPDVWLAPHYLTQMVAAMEANPQAGSAAGCLFRVEKLGNSPQMIDSTGLYMRRSRRQGLRFSERPITEHPNEPSFIFGPDGAAAVYRRTMLEDIAVEGEIFDEDFFMHKEDIDVCWRAQLRGWSSVYVPNAIAHHVRHFRPGQREHVSDKMRLLGVRNRYLLMLKNEIPTHFWRDLWAIFPYDFGIFIYILLRERTSLKAFVSLWKLRPRMIHKRKIIQNNRKVSWREINQWFRS